MPNDKSGKAGAFKDLIGELEGEFEAEKAASMTKEDQALAEIARRMLRLERDMTMPGSATSTAARVERLSRFIEEEQF
ncbi:MAG: hypothetical protein WCG13_12435 [Burkholderiales bacterium]